MFAGTVEVGQCGIFAEDERSVIKELFRQEKVAEAQASIRVETSCIHPLKSPCPDDGVEQ